jgi:hypothetical protein
MKKLSILTLTALLFTSCAVSITFGSKKDKPYGLDLTKNGKGGLDASVIKPVKSTIPVMLVMPDGTYVCKNYTSKQFEKEFGALDTYSSTSTSTSFCGTN